MCEYSGFWNVYLIIQQSGCLQLKFYESNLFTKNFASAMITYVLQTKPDILPHIQGSYVWLKSTGHDCNIDQIFNIFQQII